MRNLPLYGTVEYKQLYRGISLTFYGNGEELEHDFQVDAGADPAQIALSINGANKKELNPDCLLYTSRCV